MQIENVLPQGTKVRFKLMSGVSGLGIISGIVSNGEAVIGRTMIVGIEKWDSEFPGCDMYSHIPVFESQIVEVVS